MLQGLLARWRMTGTGDNKLETFSFRFLALQTAQPELALRYVQLIEQTIRMDKPQPFPSSHRARPVFIPGVRVDPLSTQAVTHQRESIGSNLSTSTLIYRPLSTSSALAQSGAIRPGETASTAKYFNPRQHIQVPRELAESVFRGFAEQLTALETATRHKEPTDRRADDKLSERATLELMLYLRQALFRGAAELLPQFPRCPIFKTPAFCSTHFREWAATALDDVSALNESNDIERGQSQRQPPNQASSLALEATMGRVEREQSRLVELVKFLFLFSYVGLSVE